ncbi:MAG: MmcQ/YjbR family DNA-binding protein [Bacteroidia bacterium]|jgi:predicted DNA-binding protein (MmcQ/YjbR family)|nr:MmcQ/YjbR family DNA-binding protein [Bacteroidia bacterium]
MEIETFRAYCLSLPASEETMPFDDDVLVFKVMGKMFALTSFSSPYQCNLKCDPDEAIKLREQFESVKPGYHMSKVHWNTVEYNKDVSDTHLLKMVQDSYQLIIKSLPKKVQAEWEKIKNKEN